MALSISLILGLIAEKNWRKLLQCTLPIKSRLIFYLVEVCFLVQITICVKSSRVSIYNAVFEVLCYSKIEESSSLCSHVVRRGCPSNIEDWSTSTYTPQDVQTSEKQSINLSMDKLVTIFCCFQDEAFEAMESESSSSMGADASVPDTDTARVRIGTWTIAHR